MTKIKQKFVKVTVTGFIKAPDFTAAAFKDFEGRVHAIETVAKDQMTDVKVVKKELTRHVTPDTVGGPVSGAVVHSDHKTEEE